MINRAIFQDDFLPILEWYDLLIVMHFYMSQPD